VEFSSKLKELRLQRDISLRKLGEKTGISYSILNSIENGRFQPSKEIVVSLAYALRHDNVEELLNIAGYNSSEDNE
jgi:transcriptional regulator with XRE-family HTH domain